VHIGRFTARSVILCPSGSITDRSVISPPVYGHTGRFTDSPVKSPDCGSQTGRFTDRAVIFPDDSGTADGRTQESRKIYRPFCNFSARADSNGRFLQTVL
jgi:hypothetical protein